MRIGPGLMQNKDTLFATKAGHLKYSPQHKFYWIENNQKRVCIHPFLPYLLLLLLLQSYLSTIYLTQLLHIHISLSTTLSNRVLLRSSLIYLLSYLLYYYSMFHLPRTWLLEWCWTSIFIPKKEQEMRRGKKRENRR